MIFSNCKKHFGAQKRSIFRKFSIIFPTVRAVIIAPPNDIILLCDSNHKESFLPEKTVKS